MPPLASERTIAVVAPLAGERPFLPWVEAARTVLMAGVVFVHANIFAVPQVERWWPFGLWSCLPLAILVPAFFAIAGLVLGLDPSLVSPAFDTRRFIRSKLRSIALPFFAWNAILILVRWGIEGSAKLGAGEVAFRLLMGQWHLYFLAALLQCFALVLGLRRHLHGKGLAAVVVTSGLVSAAFYGLASALFWTGIRQDGFFEDNLDRTFAPWCFCFFLGLWLGRSPRARATLGRVAWLLALLAAGAFQLYLVELRVMVRTWPEAPVLQFLASGFPFQVLGALAFVGLFERLGRMEWARRPLDLLARAATLSFGVYLCHNAILASFLQLWLYAGWPLSPQVVVPALFGATLAASALVAYAGGRLGAPGRLLFAVRGPPRAQRDAIGKGALGW